MLKVIFFQNFLYVKINFIHPIQDIMKNVLFVGILVFFVACASAPKGTVYWVNSYKVDCNGVGPMKCMLIQKGETLLEEQWENFYAQIEGFDYEPGFMYKLLVQEEELENAPADASSLKYTLIEILEKKQDDKPLLNGNWELKTMNGSIVKLPKIQGAGLIPCIQIDIAKMHLSGIDGCNHLNGVIKSIKEDKIEFGPIAGTMKMCPDMTLADSFNRAMSKVHKFKVENQKLLFFSEEGTELLEFQKGTEARILLNDIWVAEQIEGEMIMDKSNAPSLEIHTSDMEVMGSDGCNNYMGKIQKLTNNDLVFGPLAGTRKMCEDMTVADKFNAAMVNVRQYKISKVKLRLMDAEGKVLVVLKKVD